jgi:hypothetical protein
MTYGTPLTRELGLFAQELNKASKQETIAARDLCRAQRNAYEVNAGIRLLYRDLERLLNVQIKRF